MFINVSLPFMDIAFTLFCMSRSILALTGRFYIVGLMSLSVLPETLLSFLYLNWYQSNKFFELLEFKSQKKHICRVYLEVSNCDIPISVIGYIQEFSGLKRVWKYNTILYNSLRPARI